MKKKGCKKARVSVDLVYSTQSGREASLRKCVIFWQARLYVVGLHCTNNLFQLPRPRKKAIKRLKRPKAKANILGVAKCGLK